MATKVSPERGAGWTSLLLSPAPALQFLLPAVVAILTSLPALPGEFVWDDKSLIVRDDFVHHAANIPAAFLRSFWAGTAVANLSYDYYRPLTTISYILTNAFAGPHALAHHEVNTIVYALTAGLLARVVCNLGAGSGVGLAAGVVFAAWPTHVENVSFISGRTDLLAGLFMLLAVTLSLRHRRDPSREWLVLTGLCLVTALAALSKEIGYLTPVGIALMEWTAPPRRGRWARILVTGLPVAAVAGVGFWVLRGRGWHESVPPLEMLTALVLDIRYLVVPWPNYIGTLRVGMTSPALPLAVLAWLALVGLGFRVLRGPGPRAAWTLGWMLLLPSCLLGVGTMRFVYMSSMVLIPVVTWRLSAAPWPGAVRAGIVAGATLAGAAQSAISSTLWLTERSVFEEVVRCSPLDGFRRDELAEVYQGLGLARAVPDSTRTRWLELSAEQTRFALAQMPNRPRPWFALARTSLELGSDLLALDCAQRGLGMVEDAGGRFTQARALTNLGLYGQADTAVVLSLAPREGKQDAERWALMGWIRFKRGAYSESIEALRRALILSPRHPVAAYNRALAFACAGRPDSAGAQYRTAMRHDADGSGAVAALSDIIEVGVESPPQGEACARAFLSAAGLPRGTEGALAPSALSRLRGVLPRAAAAWPPLGRLAGTTEPR
ncbi:MAG: hypothetical protein HZB25_14080 [Candidatus Eisenbacteria bacterium]|nr:hypothetical protein [Candidatus Eisenbacteria bacterium]